ncbi:MAG: FtsX-like permease family protein [bacterium]
MTTFGLIFKEIAHRKLNFVLSSFAVMAAVAFFVSFVTGGEASNRETTRLMRDIGYNLRIIPKETDMVKFWDVGFSDLTMPEEYIHRFAEETRSDLSYRHLMATLQQKISWRDMDVLLTGIASEEIAPPGAMKPSMSFSVDPGTVYLGFELARSANLKKGDTIEIAGNPFTVAACLSEEGSDVDIRIYGHLKDVQTLLGLEGKINEIRALDCLCRNPNVDPLEILREQLAEVLPEGKVIQMKAIADARQKQRVMVERIFAQILPLVLIACAIWIGALAFINTRDRQSEIGILRALGYGSGNIAFLFLGKAMVIGIIGAAVGFFIGTQLALKFGPEIFEVTAKMIKPTYSLLGWSIVVAPAFAMLSSFIPTVIAVTQDPAVTLREE